jgi:hypothetical protein
VEPEPNIDLFRKSNLYECAIDEVVHRKGKKPSLSNYMKIYAS